MAATAPPPPTTIAHARRPASSYLLHSRLNHSEITMLRPVIGGSPLEPIMLTREGKDTQKVMAEPVKVLES